MGYAGSHLEDYYGYQLVDEVIRQLNSDRCMDKNWGVGSPFLLKKRLKEALKLVNQRFPKIKPE